VEFQSLSEIVLTWGWTEPAPWFGVLAGVLLSFWLIGRRGRSIDRPAGVLVALAGIFVSPLAAAAVAGLAAATHPRALPLRFRAAMGALTFLGFVLGGSAIATAWNDRFIPVVELVGLAGVITAAWWLRKTRLAGRDERRGFSAAQRREVIERDGNFCNYCGADGSAVGVSLEMDHVTPWSQGGKTDVKNAQLLCSRHNRAKGDRSDAEARRRYRERYSHHAGSWRERHEVPLLSRS
jgi:hypothetical protein